MVAQHMQAAGPEAKTVEFLTQPSEVSFCQLRQVLTNIFPLSDVNVATLVREEGLFRFETTLDTNSGLTVVYKVFKYPLDPLESGLYPPTDIARFLLSSCLDVGGVKAFFYPNDGVHLVDSSGCISGFIPRQFEVDTPSSTYFPESKDLMFELGSAN